MPDEQHLDILRKQIDEFDHRLIELLSKRAKLFVEVGKLKRDSETPIYAPHRERTLSRQGSCCK